MAKAVKKLKIGTQFRTFNVDRSAVNKDTRTVELSFSSDSPVQRYYGLEVLDHSPAACDLTRLNSGAPLLCNHDADEQVGVVESAHLDGNKGRAIVRFGTGECADEVFQDVLGGIRQLVSVGYRVNAVQLQSKTNGVETYRVTKWQPFEISIVSIPADNTVGIGRSDEADEAREITIEIPESMKQNLLLDPAPAIELPAPGAASDAGENRTIEILAIGEEHNENELARDAVRKKTTVLDFRKQIMEKYRTKAKPAPALAVGESALTPQFLARLDRNTRQHRMGQVISDEAASFLAAAVIQAGDRQKCFSDMDSGKRDQLCGRAAEILGIATRTALTTTDIPMPTEFGSEVVELVWKYGQARQFGTVYPMGTGIVKLPKLTTSPAFSLNAISATVSEKSPQFAFVTLTASKWGGMIRIPSEIDADSIVALGQFLARYTAREMAKIEDTVFWVGDGTATYDSLSGLLLQAYNVGATRYVQQAAGKTAVADVTLTNLRDIRGKVDSAALNSARYFMNRTLENKLCAFNTSATVTPYIANGPGGKASLDGFGIEWVDVLPTVANTTASTQSIGFGDPSYHYLGVRPGMMVEQSREVYFATDEIGMRALERFTTGLMSTGAFATIVTAAA